MEQSFSLCIRECSGVSHMVIVVRSLFVPLTGKIKCFRTKNTQGNQNQDQDRTRTRTQQSNQIFVVALC